MLIHPWDAARDETEWREWLARHDFGQLAVNGAAGEPPLLQPLHFAYEAAGGGEPDAAGGEGYGRVLTHLARPNPLWDALERRPEVLLGVVDDYAFVPGPWQAPADVPPEHGVPTSLYAAVQLRCTAHVVDDPEEKAALLQAQMDHFQRSGTSAPVAAGTPPYGRMLAGIRGLRLEVTEVRAKFKYADHRPEEVRQRISDGLAGRAEGRDLAARATQLRRRGLAG